MADKAKTTTPANTTAAATTTPAIAEARAKVIVANAQLCALNRDIIAIELNGKAEVQLWTKAKVQALIENSYTEEEVREQKDAQRGQKFGEAIDILIIGAGKPVYEDITPGAWGRKSDFGLRAKQSLVYKIGEKEFIGSNSGFLKEAVDEAANNGKWLAGFSPLVASEQSPVKAQLITTYGFMPSGATEGELSGKFIRTKMTNVRVVGAAFTNWEPTPDELKEAQERSDDF